MSTSTVAVPATGISERRMRQLKDMSIRPVDGGYRHSPCGESFADDPEGHFTNCEIGKIKARGYLPCDDGRFLHVACSSRTEDMNSHERECHARLI